jgi:predicted RNase H-like HicB family nuclease
MMKKQPIVYEREGAARHSGSAKKSARRQPVRSGGYAYAAVFEPAEEGGYVVRFPAFGHLATQGETMAEARAMAVDCLEGRIASMLEAGEELPRSDVAAGLPKVEIVRVKPKAA